MAFEGTIQAICQQLTESLEAERCTIRVPHGKTLRLIAAYGIDAERRQKEIPINGTIAGNAAIGGDIIHIPDILKDSRYDPTYIKIGDPKALLVIPLLFEGNLFGMAQIYRKEPFSYKQISLANALAQFAAVTLFHIETSKMNRQAILDVVESIFESTSTNEIFRHAVRKISDRIEVPRCLIYRISSAWCEIVAGEPEGAHKIGLRESLRQHQDIEYAVNEKNIFVVDQPLTDPRTQHFRRIIENEKIRAILYAPLILKRGNGNDKNEVIGVLVLDACNDKQNFSAEEKSFCLDAGRIIAKLIDRDKTALDETLREIEHNLRNPNISIGGHVNKLIEPLTKIFEIIENECKNPSNTCSVAQRIYEIMSVVLPRAERIRIEAEKIDQSIWKVKQNHI